MRKRKELIFSIFIIIAAIICGGLCIHHYGMGVQPYYRAKLGDVTLIVRGTCWLEDGTIVEQRYVNRDSYMAGVDLLMLGTGEGCEGRLCVQLCDYDGNVLSQKNEELADIEDGQFHSIQFLNAVDVRDHDFLMIRIFEGSSRTPGIVTLSSLDDIKDNINCSVNDEVIYDNLAIMYLYGKWTYVGYDWKNNGVWETLIASLLLIIIGASTAIYLFCSRKKIKIKSAVMAWKQNDNFKQILSVLWFFEVFLAASVIYKIRNSENVPVGVYLYLIFIAGITVYYLYRRRKEHRQGVNKFAGVIRDKGLIAVVLFSTLIRLPLFVHKQLWDGSIYYGGIQAACKGFEYTFSYIWDHFRLAGHYAIVYTFFTAIGEFLFPDNMTGVLLVMLVLTDCALVCIYKMLRNYWLNLSQKEAAIGTMLVSICPLVLGLFSNVSLEHLLFVFTIFLFYAEYKEQTIMKIVWLVSIMMTKETGLVIVGGYLLVHIAVHLKDTIKYPKKGKLQYFFSDFSVVSAVGGLALVCLYTIKQKGLFVWLGMNQKHGGNLIKEYIENLPENFPFFLHKMKLLFVLHFQWIPVLAILFCIIHCVVKHRKMLSFKGQVSFLSTLGIFLLLNFYLVQYELGRYHVYSAAMIWILAYILLLKTFKTYLRNTIRFGATIAVMLLLLIQNFYFIDPMTNLAFDRYDTGRGKMVATEVDGGNKGDAFTNNFRHTYLYDLIDKMLEDGAYDTDTQIIVPYEKDYLYFYAYTGYDTVKRKRVAALSPDGENVIEIRNTFLEDILEKNPEEMPERGILYFLPYVDGNEQELLQRAEQFYEISERREVSNWGGKLSYYILKHKV